MSDYKCTYCGSDLGSLSAHGPGDELHCDECDVTYDLVAEDSRYDLVGYECPYCGTVNNRDRGVETNADPPFVVCENDGRVRASDGYTDDECGRRFDPTGVETHTVETEVTKMVARRGVN